MEQVCTRACHVIQHQMRVLDCISWLDVARQPLFRDCTCSTRFWFNEIQNYLAACSDNALKLSFVNVYFSNPRLSPTSTGVVCCLSSKGSLLAYLRIPVRKATKMQILKRFTVFSVRNHDDNFTLEHMFMILWETQIAGMYSVYFAVADLCSDSGCGSS